MGKGQVTNTMELTESIVDKFVAYVNGLGLDYSTLPPEFSYSNAALICIDAVLSINRRYDSFVKPRVERFAQCYPEITRLEQLQDLIAQHGYEDFHVVWNYRHPERVRLLHQLVDWFITYRQTTTFEADLDAMKHWAVHAPLANLGVTGIKGIGFATAQYIRMMLGVSTIKPDRHIKHAIRDGLGHSLSNVQVVELAELAARRLGVPVNALDYAIWEKYSGR